jgi:biotin carboxyl carrier protein
LILSPTPEPHEWLLDDKKVAAAADHDSIWVDTGDEIAAFGTMPPQRDAAADPGDPVDSPVHAAMAGRVASTTTDQSQRIKKGEPVLTLEAMKTEIQVFANRNGVVKLRCKVGDMISRGQVLFVIEADEP